MKQNVPFFVVFSFFLFLFPSDLFSSPKTITEKPSSIAPNTKDSAKVKSVHGSWTTVCHSLGASSKKQCAIMQNVAAQDRPEITLSVVVMRTEDSKRQLLRVLSPLGVLLPNGLGLKIDNNEIGRADFIRCFQDGCYAEVILDKKLLLAFKKGNSALFIIFQSPDSGIGIPVDLKGFDKALSSLP